MKRNSHQQAKLRARIAASKPACHICGLPIRYELPHTDPKSFVIDHVIPLAKGGEDALSNVRAAHRRPRLQQHEARTHSRTHHPTKRSTRLARGESPTPEATKTWDPLESTCRHASLSIL